LDLPPRVRQLLLEVFHDMEAVDRYPDAFAKHFLARIDVPLPHIAGDFLHLCQQAARLLLSQVVDYTLLVTTLKNVQHAPVGVVDDHTDELPVLFFRDSSSMPMERMGLCSAVGACCWRSTWS
jgi:hypothetical protein